MNRAKNDPDYNQVHRYRVAIESTLPMLGRRQSLALSFETFAFQQKPTVFDSFSERPDTGRWNTRLAGGTNKEFLDVDSTVNVSDAILTDVDEELNRDFL